MCRMPRLVLVISFVLALGCGGKGPKLAKVSGKVMLDNQPLSGADVTFQSVGADGKPDPSKESAGMTDDQGQYTLKSVAEKRDGAIPGSYRVLIRKIERGERMQNVVPPQYNQNTKLTFSVPAEGTSEANFDLKSK